MNRVLFEIGPSRSCPFFECPGPGFDPNPGARNFAMPRRSRSESLTKFPVNMGKIYEDSVVQLMKSEKSLAVTTKSKLNPEAPEFHPRVASKCPSVQDVMSDRIGPARRCVVEVFSVPEDSTQADQDRQECWQACRNPLISSILGVEFSEMDDDSDDSDWDCVDGYNPYDESPKPESEPQRRVKFCEDVEIHHLDDAEDPSRAGPWHSMYLDSLRFRERILRQDALLSLVLNPEHRQKIYAARFSSPADDS